MPSLQDALQSALASKPTQTINQIPEDWDEETTVQTTTQPATQAPEQPVQNTPKYLFQVTNNVSRLTHGYMLQNPGKTRAQIIAAMEAQGFNGGSVGALLSNMTRQKLVTFDGAGGMFAKYKTYRPVKSHTRHENDMLRAELGKPSKRAVKKAEPAAPREVRKVEKSSQDVTEFLNSLSVLQAKAVYDELKKLFG